MIKKIMLYGHGGSYNHGAEAIVICLTQIIRKIYPSCKIILSTHFKEQDVEFSLPVDQYCVRTDFSSASVDLEKELMYRIVYRQALDEIDKDTVCISIGGDNYCYPNWERYGFLHKRAKEVGAISILAGCSIDKSYLSSELIQILKNHDLIITRESCTYELLKANGIVQNTYLIPDPAFILEAKETALPEILLPQNTVGINASPLIIRKEKKEGIIQQNMLQLISDIMYNTNMSIALIPHVVMPMDNDYDALSCIYHQVKDQSRLCIISPRLSARQYKYIISKCRFMVSARTHAAIAAFSTEVPTLTVGYSIKAEGIAKDLGMYDYLVDVSQINNTQMLSDLFFQLYRKEEAAIAKLKNIMPDYIKKVEGYSALLYEVMNKKQ